MTLLGGNSKFKNQRCMEIPHEFFVNTPGNSTSFLIGPWNFHMLFFNNLYIYSSSFVKVLLWKRSKYQFFSSLLFKISFYISSQILFSHNFLELYSTLFEKRFLSQNFFFFNGFSQPSQWLKSTTLMKVFYQCSLRSSKPTSVSWVSLSRKIFIEITKSFGTYLFASRVLLTKFGLSVSSVLVWSPCLIENLTITHNMWFPKQ